MKSKVILFVVATCLLVTASFALSAGDSERETEELDLESRMPVHPQRIPGKTEDRLDDSMSDRAGLLFRSMDKDHDKLIGAEDVQNSAAELKEHMPEIDQDEFLVFVEIADKNNDHKLSREELFDALADGLIEADKLQTETQHFPAELLETQSEVESESHGERRQESELNAEAVQQELMQQQAAMEQGQEMEAEAETDASSEEQLEALQEALLNQQQQQEQQADAGAQDGSVSKMRFTQSQGFFKGLRKVGGFLGRHKGLVLGAGAAMLGGKLLKGAGKAMGFLKRKAGQTMRSLTGGIDKSNDGCVMCQYIVERCEGNVKLSGVLPAYSFLETDSSAHDLPPNSQAQSQIEEVPAVALSDPASPSLVEAEAQTQVQDQAQAKQFYNDIGAAAIIGSARQSTRVQRQLERQKYNEIYRVVDITLDDVCEQGMPNSFYGYCKQIYKTQTDIVDGLRYQYRPADICFRVGMCGPGSYITMGKHSRYKAKF